MTATRRRNVFWRFTFDGVIYLVFTRLPGESYRRRFRSLLLCMCGVFRALFNSLVCWFCVLRKLAHLDEYAARGRASSRERKISELALQLHFFSFFSFFFFLVNNIPLAFTSSLKVGSVNDFQWLPYNYRMYIIMYTTIITRQRFLWSERTLECMTWHCLHARFGLGISCTTSSFIWPWRLSSWFISQ